MRDRFQRTEADARHSTEQKPAGAPTIRDIARLAGVSIATVSRTLNNRGYVAPETRARVLAAASAQNFQLNTSARMLVGGHTGHVSIAVPELGRFMADKDEPSVQTYYPMDVLAGVTRELYERNLYATLIAPPMTHGRELTWVDRMIHERSDGLILVAPVVHLQAGRALAHAREAELLRLGIEASVRGGEVRVGGQGVGEEDRGKLT